MSESTSSSRITGASTAELPVVRFASHRSSCRAAGSNGAAFTGGEQVADLLKQHDVVGVRSLGLLLSETRLDIFVWGDDEKIDDHSDDQEGHQLHLASALSLADELEGIVTYERLGVAAGLHGVAVLALGRE